MQDVQFKSVKSRNAGLAGVCLLGSVVVLTAWSVVSSRNSGEFVSSSTEKLLGDKAQEYLSQVDATQANGIFTEIRNAMDAARDEDNHLRRARRIERRHARRGSAWSDQCNSEDRTLEREAGLNGTYNAWEPNAVDGQDAGYAGKQQTDADATGRFVPYWTRGADGRIAVQPLVEYDSRDLHPNGVMKGGWYIGPRKPATKACSRRFLTSCRARTCGWLRCRCLSSSTVNSRGSVVPTSTLTSCRSWRPGEWSHLRRQGRSHDP